MKLFTRLQGTECEQCQDQGGKDEPSKPQQVGNFIEREEANVYK